MTCGFRNCQSRACGSTVRPDGHELAYCVAHEAIARHLPTLRSARCCTSEGCGRPQGSRSPLCKSCRPRYSAWGLDGYPVPQEAPMTEPTPLSKLPELGFARIQVQTTGAALSDLEAAVARATDATPTPPAAPQETADGGATPSAHPLEARRDRLVATLLGAGFEEKPAISGRVRRFAYCNNFWVIVPNGPAAESQEDFARALDTAEAGLKRLTSTVDAPHLPVAPTPAVDAVEPSEGDVADAPLFVGGTDSAPELVARWGQKHTAPPQPMSPDLDGLAALAARGQQPTAPGPTLADVQAELARERERADRAELDAVAERARADEALEELATIAALLDPEDAPAYDSDDQPIPLPVRVQTALMPDTAYERELRKSLHAVEAELFEVDRTMQHLGAYGNGPTIDRLLKVLTPEDRRNILELQAAEARLDLARLKASRLNPPPPEKLAEYAAKVAEVEARIAALDAGDVRG